MALMVKVCAAGFLTAVVSLMIRRSNSEISLALNACCMAVILLCVLRSADSLSDMTKLVSNVLDSSGKYISPILKCLGIAVITKFASELCRDASQSAVSASVEFAGVLCALCAAMPILMSVLSMIGGLV